VFTGSLAFNLLMGKRWPPGPGDLEQADRLCRELGLGDLVDRMPSGLLESVGEGGWLLSHGERSRVFLARALLQDADLILLDEAFGALDPDNLDTAITCALRRAKTLVVVAHP
jgi:ATP-binding cassette subfamily B protein